MSVPRITKACFILLSFSFASHIVYKYFRRKKEEKVIREINEVIIFAEQTGQLKKSKYSRCLISGSMERVLYYLNTPKHSLDICIYVFTSVDIANAVVKLHHRGIRVRVIIDADMAFCSGSITKRLEKLGVNVRWMKSTNLMHHKFCLIDAAGETGTPIVLSGSLNWTNQALSGNWESIVVTSQKDIVQQYSAEFERLWTLFKPIVS